MYTGVIDGGADLPEHAIGTPNGTGDAIADDVVMADPDIFARAARGDLFQSWRSEEFPSYWRRTKAGVHPRKPGLHPKKAGVCLKEAGMRRRRAGVHRRRPWTVICRPLTWRRRRPPMATTYDLSEPVNSNMGAGR